jgi:hypothetical protein
MAIGTMTLAAQHSKELLFVDEITLVGDTSYPTNGSTGVQTALQALTKDQREIIDVKAIDSNGYVCSWDRVNLKLRMFYGDNNNASDGPLVEVPNTTTLNGITFRLLVTSK